MELRPPTARKSHPNFFAHCKRSTKMKEYKKKIIPNVQNTMRTQVTPMVSNYGKVLTKRYSSISKHHVNAWFMYLWLLYINMYRCIYIIYNYIYTTLYQHPQSSVTRVNHGDQKSETASQLWTMEVGTIISIHEYIRLPLLISRSKSTCWYTRSDLFPP